MKGSKFVRCVYIYPWSWIAKQSLCPHHIDVVVAISAFSIQRPAVCIATYFNPEVFVLKKYFLQERMLSEWTMDILQSRGISPPEETQVCQNAEQDCAQCGGPG